MYEIFIGLGIIISLIYNELTDLSPGGLITPGYIVLFIDQPFRILITLLLALVTYLIVKGLSKVLPVFGKRRFALCVVIAIVLKFSVSSFSLMDTSLLMSSIGVIIPGLISNDMLKQGVEKTVLSLALVSGGLFGLLSIMRRVI